MIEVGRERPPYPVQHRRVLLVRQAAEAINRVVRVVGGSNEVTGTGTLITSQFGALVERVVIDRYPLRRHRIASGLALLHDFGQSSQCIKLVGVAEIVDTANRRFQLTFVLKVLGIFKEVPLSN